MNNEPIRLDSIDAAISAMAAGQAVVVVDDADRENEGDIIFAAELATPELMGWTIRHSSGVVCTPMTGERADAMGLPPMVENNQDAKGTAYTVSCDAAHGVSTGISAADRALTSRILADPASGPDLITRPGHIFPLRAVDGGVLVRRGHTEASVDLCVAAGLEPVGVIAELVHDDGSMMRLPALREFADLWNIPLISIEDLAAWRAASDAEPVVGTSSAAVQGGPEVRVPTPYGEFNVRAWRERNSGTEHLSLSAPGPDGTMPAEPLVRVHSECLTGDVFGSYRCDCGEQLAAGLEAINEFGGVLIYLRGHEGRGIGLANKIRAYALQDGGANTVAANEQLGLPVDARTYDGAAAILHAMAIDTIRLITNNPLKEEWLDQAGITVAERVPTRVAARPENLEYLRTKQELLHHTLQLPTNETTTNPGAQS
ncbi:MAG: 3,4-dihydroxy-2-butanone-4-phosphate synthase [Paeniglutamicibacter terrestris]|jgi:3,4-dihydroxy 2-butanone 4-phosphate synthase/GTP cyclohydrolase II|uniref:GTP cyclohydrolase-2 n=1 Tax=Paeniglutamicibacter terrestris TaxID=2723403 RepID=A0ABX1G3J8_9MICC|nr:3,4-dihydroxy-2-butanone-4-phosphate synthase [Paeniglutamicibacter terrestris]ASN39060.1 3,4-dihydroxy-2-butanone-4-phosphate synthase [Arthrobacter sp. 7749]NKG20603.1 3,4-dihydroxy-2-butanone-4-phosphate synthase [Paeniglutamicibacter terrestris]